MQSLDLCGGVCGVFCTPRGAGEMGEKAGELLKTKLCTWGWSTAP